MATLSQIYTRSQTYSMHGLHDMLPLDLFLFFPHVKKEGKNSLIHSVVHYNANHSVVLLLNFTRLFSTYMAFFQPHACLCFYIVKGWGSHFELHLSDVTGEVWLMLPITRGVWVRMSYVFSRFEV